MRIINLEQNTDAWYKWRDGKIGASDTNIIMGKSKFMTPKELLERKLGITKEDPNKNTYIQDKGHKVESLMIDYYRFVLDADDLVSLCGESNLNTYMSASFDGYSESKRVIWEHKLVGKADFEKVMNGEMLPQYEYQVQHQLYVSGFDECCFAVTKEIPKDEADNPDFPYLTTHIMVKSSCKKILELNKACKDFKDALEGKSEIETTRRDTEDKSSEDDLTELLAEYVMIKKMEERKKEIEEIFREKAKDTKISCNGFKISVSDPIIRRSIDYKTFIKDNDINIPESYMKTSNMKGKLTVTIPKGEK